ncbi:uncharacterized protein LOC124458037 isoform X2 [Xenia sp. Carnegie-2017]|uniref:uncharacterized protein LOC124458037 isoform X2 n=1 Tax=Xenia sp. Carnegie-2017 TaxID=2897299 RepID=UPI001F04E436|nr:uncharacterized protein LOC124458037 isoform X2 [Xenia sp. Carnegie-2017]
MRRQNRTWVPTRPGRPTVFSLVSTVSCHKLDVKRFSVITRSIQVDEATDVSTKEQLSVIVRMDKGKVSLKDSLGLLMLVVIGLQLLYHQWLRRILEQSSILYSILQDKDTDFHYGMSRFERFKAFVASLRNDTEYCQVYDLAVEKVGPPVTRVFKMWKGEVPSEKINLLKEVYGDMFDIPMLVSQLCFIYRDKDFHCDSCDELLKYIFQFHYQSSIPEVVKLLKINGVLSITSASVERSFSCLKRVKNYLRNTMSQGRFSSLCRISIHKDILSEKEDANTLHDEVVKKFIENHEDLLSYTNRYSYMADSKLMMSYVHGM